jgi:myo-inositol-1(or 4)-monophosphatase
MPDAEPMPDADLVLAVASAGAAVVRAGYGTVLDRIEKGAGDFATAADLEAERVIVDLLRAERPDDAVFGEEGGRSGSGDNGREWLIDPLCGTLNYAVRTSLVSVNIALRTGGETTVAASADPFSDEIFWTDKSDAFVRRDGRDHKLQPSSASDLVDVNLDPPFPNDPAFRAVSLLADRDFVARFRPRVVSTTLAVAWVAAGRRAAYVTDGQLADSVHFAAGLALCQAAGCVVTGLLGEPLHTGVGGLVVAADEETHGALLSLIGRQFAV